MADILFLAHRIPYPPDRGDKIRSWHLLRHLAGLGRVHLACFADDAADATHLTEVRSRLGSALGEAHVEVRRKGRVTAALQAMHQGRPISLALFDSPSMRKFVKDRLADPAVGTVFAFSGQMAQFVPADARQAFVMDFVDADSAKFESYAKEARGPMRWVHRREAEKLAAFERVTAGRARTSLFVSKAEADLFTRRTGLSGADIRALPNGVDLDVFDARAAVAPPASAPEGVILLFTGQMDYRPNVDAVRFFAEQVLPLIRAERPDAQFVIAGRGPIRDVLGLASQPGVTVTGAVPDMRSWLKAASVVVAPLRIARGVQNKVLEAMAMARPVVASPQAFEGIDAEPGRHLLIADGAQAQARAVLDLLSDHDRAEAVGKAGRANVERRYRWEAVLAPLADIVGAEPIQAAA